LSHIYHRYDILFRRSNNNNIFIKSSFFVGVIAIKMTVIHMQLPYWISGFILDPVTISDDMYNSDVFIYPTEVAIKNTIDSPNSTLYLNLFLVHDH